MSKEHPTLNWRSKYSSLEEYYDNEFDPKFFHFNKYQREVDPLEPFELIEAYSEEKKQEELTKCAVSFAYWCHKYVKITHPKRGLLPFITYRYQKRCIQEYEKHRFNILSKFRQGGLTTVTTIWCLWRCLFKLDETIMVLSKSDREAIAAGEIVKRALIELPEWMKPQMEKNNDHQKIFSDTGCKLFFYTPEAARGRSITYLVLDEAAFIQNMDKHWKSMFPTLSNGGHCICISTVNGVGNWYYDTFKGAEKKPPQNDFNIIELDYWEHPDYYDAAWIKSTRAQLGEKGWRQEVMRDFLGAGESYIPSNIINDLDLITREIEPLRKMFPDWNNHSEARERRVDELDDWKKGALNIWRDPIPGRDYIIGVDCGEGMGEENDNNCFQIIDALTCEQVGEFYSNICPVHNFTQILCMIGYMYNAAQIVVESQSHGLTVLDKLQNEFFYENLYETEGSGKSYAGVKTTKSNRPLYLDALKTRLINNSIAVRSRRLVNELKGFIWNAQTGRAQASSGFHDDAIMALCLAIFAKNSQHRDAPIGTDKNMSETFKAEIYEHTKQELMKNAPEEWIDPDELELLETANRGYDTFTSEFYAPMRRHDAIKREFGWILAFASTGLTYYFADLINSVGNILC